MKPRTIGVEEELLLVDPGTRQVVARSGGAVAANLRGEEVAAELFAHQIETSTEPVSDAADLEGAVRAGRRAVGEAAAAVGARAVAVATPPLAAGEQEYTRNPRYLRFEDRFGLVAREAHVCAMHVHVAVADETEGVLVLDRVRPWLPLLTALSANSPYWQGHDTGFASWRSQVWGRWSTAGPREQFGDVRGYREVAERMVAWGGALDPGMLYFDARLSEQFPTVEVRVADVCAEVDDAVLVALLARALVATCAVDQVAPPWRTDLLRVATWRASRHGLADDLVHPQTLELASPRVVFDALLATVADALEQTGDRAQVGDLFERLLARGGGAVRQRRTFERSGDLVAVVDDLADLTEASWL